MKYRHVPCRARPCIPGVCGVWAMARKSWDRFHPGPDRLRRVARNQKKPAVEFDEAKNSRLERRHSRARQFSSRRLGDKSIVHPDVIGRRQHAATLLWPWTAKTGQKKGFWGKKTSRGPSKRRTDSPEEYSSLRQKTARDGRGQGRSTSTNLGRANTRHSLPLTMKAEPIWENTTPSASGSARNGGPAP